MFVRFTITDQRLVKTGNQSSKFKHTKKKLEEREEKTERHKQQQQENKCTYRQASESKPKKENRPAT